MNLPAFLPVLFFSSLVATGNDWSQWRGPNRDDVSTESGLLKQWPAEGPQRVWLNTNIGNGYSGLVVAGGKLFTIGTREGKETLLAFDANNGKELWTAPLDGAGGDDARNGPSSTPAVDGDRIYAMSSSGLLVCAKTADGAKLWTKTMQSLGGKKPSFGYAESPLVDGKLVLITPGGAKGTMAALDKMTGDVVWQSAEITEAAPYSSIVPLTLGGKRQYVQLVEKMLFGVDAETGKVAWKMPQENKGNIIPTPIVKGDGVVIDTGETGALKAVVNGGEVKQAFKSQEFQIHQGGALCFGDHLYGHSDKGGWKCVSFADGAVKWQANAIGRGSITCADGMLYCLDESTGMVALVEASPANWAEKGRVKIEPQSTKRDSGDKIWTHPTVANGKLYLRDQEYIYCYSVKN